MRPPLSATLLLALLVPLALHAQDLSPADYEPVRQAVAPGNAARISVEEFFWYGCPHCYALEPSLEEWAKSKPADVDFTPVPISLGRDIGILHSATFYVEVLLGVQDKVHRPLFDALRLEPATLDTPEELQQFVATKAGLPVPTVRAAFDAFMVESNVRRAEDLAQRYGVVSTPTIVVGGQYRVKPAESVKLLKVVDALVDKVRRERAAAPPTPAPPSSAVGSSPPAETAIASGRPANEGGNGTKWIILAAITFLVVLGIWATRPR